MIYDEEEEYEEWEEEWEECEDAMTWLGSMLDSISTIANQCICTFKEVKKDKNTIEWVLKCDYYTVTITLQEKPK
jgi:hypothetical protein